MMKKVKGICIYKPSCYNGDDSHVNASVCMLFVGYDDDTDSDDDMLVCITVNEAATATILAGYRGNSI